MIRFLSLLKHIDSRGLIHRANRFPNSHKAVQKTSSIKVCAWCCY